jgi:hypothetical protein
MKRLVVGFTGMALMLVLAGPARAADGCCVCGDGRCLDSVAGMGECVKRCQPSQTHAYNAAGQCNDKCYVATVKVRREQLSGKGAGK